MIQEVIVYKNTGFNAENIPDGYGVLANAEKEIMQNHVFLQTQGLAYFDMETTVEQIQNVDYVQIGNNFYNVTGYQMLNENCARVHLLMDTVTTIGLQNMNFVSGWTTRWCPSNNTIFSNVVDEPFIPSQEFVLEEGGTVGASSNNSNVDLLGSTIDLENVQSEAIKFKVPDSEDDAVIVPKLPTPAKETTFKLSERFGNAISNILPSICFYDPNDDKISSSITNVRSLGVDSCLVYSYQVPDAYVSPIKSGIRYSEVKGRGNENTTSGIKYKYGNYTPKEMKAYSGQFHKIKLCAMLSGETSQEYKPEDIMGSTDETSPTFTYYSDPQPNGTVYFRPKYYKGNSDNYLIESIKGLGWRNIPISFTGASGQQKIDINTAFEQVGNVWNMGKQVIQSKVQSLKNAETAISNPTKLGEAAASEWQNKAGLATSLIEGAAGMFKTQYNYEYDKNIIAPEIKFTRSEGLQSYLPNSAFVYGYHLSDIDLQRFDDYLIRYGWADFKKFEKTDLFTRSHFNYIAAQELTIVCNAPAWMRQIAKATLEGGVRIWHELPNEAAYSSNTVV